MAAKQIAYQMEAREAIRRGVKQLARAVKATLGPCGRNVVIEKSFGAPTATIYAEAIYDEGLKNVAAGAEAMSLKRGIEQAVEAVVDELKKMTTPIKGTAQIAPG